MTIAQQTIGSLQRMAEDRSLSDIYLLDGDVTVTIDFDDRSSATLTVMQTLPADD